MLNMSLSDKKIGQRRHLGWTSIQGKKGSGNLGQSNEENAGLPVKPQSMHKCIEKEVSGAAETSCLQDGWLQTHHTRNDKLGLNPQRDSRLMK